MANPCLITNGRVLLADGQIVRTPLLLDDGRIQAIEPMSGKPGASVWDAEDALVLPGIVDLHGDAFERQMLPRPGVRFPHELALAETDRQLLANGITTAFHGITYSWEPGLRGRDSAFQLIRTIEQMRRRLRCDTRIHLRWETYNLAAEPDIADLIAEKRIDLLAFNDHGADIRYDLESEKRHKIGVYTHRTGLNAAAYGRLFLQIAAHADKVPAAISRLAQQAAAAGIPCASHDDADANTRDWFHARAVRLCEFPVDEAVVRRSQAHGDPVILGAPNVVRNASHRNRFCATTATAKGLCDILTSDYYYPSLLNGVFLLMSLIGCAIGEVWPMVSPNPAQVAGLVDQGQIAERLRADILLVDDRNIELPEVTVTFVAGTPVHKTRRARAAQAFHVISA